MNHTNLLDGHCSSCVGDKDDVCLWPLHCRGLCWSLEVEQFHPKKLMRGCMQWRGTRSTNLQLEETSTQSPDSASGHDTAKDNAPEHVQVGRKNERCGRRPSMRLEMRRRDHEENP